MTETLPSTYLLGHSISEQLRLVRQSSLLAPFTERLLRDAGIGAGMRVLDIGCGMGDVSMLAAQLVGPSGQVVGVDLDGLALARARERTSALGLANVTFVQSDVTRPDASALFDAIVGRLVLQFLPDVSAALKALLEFVHPGGILAFQEPSWKSTLAQTAHLPLRAAVASLIHNTIQKGGAHTDMELPLYQAFQAAALPAPLLRIDVPLGGDEPTRRWTYDLMCTLWPKAAEYGLPRDGIGDLQSLAQRLDEELLAADSFAACVGLVSAHSRRPVVPL